MSATPMEVDVEESVEDSSRRKRRKLDRNDQGWGEESDDEALDAVSRRLLGDLIQKEPEHMATRELELVISTLPRFSKLQKSARAELQLRHRRKDDEELFRVPVDSRLETPTEVLPTVDITLDDAPKDETKTIPETEEILPQVPAKKPKAKRKSKKQIFEEREALKAQAAALQETAVAEEVKEDTENQTSIVEQDLEVHEFEDPSAEVEWNVSTGEPRRTVEDDPELVLDIDGWQHCVKDDEDLRFLKQALKDQDILEVTDVHLWAWKQKEIKALNTGGTRGILHAETTIQGYYVPNPSGSARTEGTTKIFEAEKSKYLPHRIRVQKEREERESLAKSEPSLVNEAAKLAAAAKQASTSSSRSNRANTRRLVNDIKTQKQGLGMVEGDAIRFNQLKKRKKLVKFDRSAIHNWGLYAEENISGNDMIIEYVGEKIRQQVANLREQRYLKQGIGSSYLFRIDEDTVIDATKKGGIARFINHSCSPNCTAKIIKVDGSKRIVIYALRDIAKSES
jgi:[histone H3]-lysine4 N-trimethyltransferase SETD1